MTHDPVSGWGKRTELINKPLLEPDPNMIYDEFSLCLLLQNMIKFPITGIMTSFSSKQSQSLQRLPRIDNINLCWKFTNVEF